MASEQIASIKALQNQMSALIKYNREQRRKRERELLLRFSKPK